MWNSEKELTLCDRIVIPHGTWLEWCLGSCRNLCCCLLCCPGCCPSPFPLTPPLPSPLPLPPRPIPIPIPRSNEKYDEITQVYFEEKKEIYISSFDAIEYNLDSLPKFIKQVINVDTQNHEFYTKSFFKAYNIDYHFLPFEDLPREQDVNRMIDVALKTSESIQYPCLIHCQNGCSRSVAIVIFLLINNEGFTADQALKQIQKYRPIAGPNYAFMDLLRDLRFMQLPSRKKEEEEKEEKEEKKSNYYYEEENDDIILHL